jgi:predicted phage terminase large subunit-like protein
VWERERARRSLIEFIRFTKPDYMVGWFNEELCKVLDQFLRDVVDGKSPRLIIEAPPRHGKTEAASRRFPAYALGRFPYLTFIATSYASDLASSINRDVQRVIDSEEYHELFPETTLWGKNIRTVADGSYLRNSDIFEIVGKRGVYKSAGVGAGIGGRGGEVLIVDDPIKDAAEAASEVVRQSIWDWFTSTLYTRAMPGGGIVVIMTRWHEADLAGRLIENARKDGEDWQIVRFPAIAEEDEYSQVDGHLLRKEGEALHPERYSLKALARIKVAVGSRVWASLYQQRPSAAEGNKFKREHWQSFKPTFDLESIDHELFRQWKDAVGIKTVIQRWDTALGEKKTDDFTACTTLAIGRNKYYVLEVWKKKIEFPEVKREVQSRFDKWRPAKVFVEGGGSASGKATVQAMKRDSIVPIFESVTTTDKPLRADTVTPSHEAGLIALPEGASWVADFVDQCSNFPNATKDDDVDSFIGAMEEALGNPGPMIITDEFLAAVGAL